MEKKVFRWGILLTLTVFLSGCAGNRVLLMDPASARPDSVSFAGALKIGSDLKVTMKDGSTESGTLRAILEEGIVVGKPSNFGLHEVLCPYESILSVETPPRGGAAAVAGNIAVGILVGTMFLFVVAAASLRNSGGCA